jgi:hypothetical protein
MPAPGSSPGVQPRGPARGPAADPTAGPRGSDAVQRERCTTRRRGRGDVSRDTLPALRPRTLSSDHTGIRRRPESTSRRPPTARCGHGYLHPVRPRRPPGPMIDPTWHRLASQAPQELCAGRGRQDPAATRGPRAARDLPRLRPGPRRRPASARGHAGGTVGDTSGHTPGHPPGHPPGGPHLRA